ncbi:MAG: gliding motility-associated C-terminal domain-containing protein [Flavobacteriales bacterium]|nr:gliding motility-associated C-terminal domain-containing protein [Flavobacteriales bacterium]
MRDIRTYIITHLSKCFGVCVLILSGLMAQGQTCASPASLCAEDAPTTDEFPLSVPVSFGCMDVENSYVYSFTTNNNAANTGNVILTVDSINCPGQTDVDTLYAMLVLPPQSGLGDPCDQSQWTQIGNCASDTLAISIETPDLDANTTYFFIVGSDQPSNQMDCQWQVAVDGPAVDINGCCDDQISLGEAAQLSAIGGDTPPGYSWEPPSYLDNISSDTPLAYPEETITYIVTGEVGGCEVTDFVTIFVGPPITTYNTFTPNGDGVNDTWEINGISQFGNCQVNVYDRWGQLVFKSLGYATPWDGTNRGKFLPMGTYYWVIELNSLDVNIPPLTGYVAIIH